MAEPERRYQILTEAPSRDFITRDTFTKEEARAEVRRRRAEGGWAGCRFVIVPEGKYAPAGGAP